LQNHLGQMHLGIRGRQTVELVDCIGPVFRRQALLRFLSLLRREKAEPDFANLLALRPETSEIPQIVRPREKLSRNCAVNNNLVARDILEDACVGCRKTPPVVLWLQTVNRYDEMKVGQTGPGSGNMPNRARDELYLNPHLGYLGKQDIQLAI